MAERSQNTNKWMVGRLKSCQILHTGSEALYLNNFKDDRFSFNDEPRINVYTGGDDQEISTETGRKVILEWTIDEVNQTTNAQVNNADYCKILTAQGGAGNGMYLEISGSDNITAKIQDFKTVITVEKSVTTGYPYTLSDI